MLMIKSYKDLNVWQKAMELADRIYEATENFPKREWYGLANQLRRAAVSIASNIAEGSTRGSKEFIHFIAIARGSVAEVETQILISAKRKYISAVAQTELEKIADDISRMAMGLSRAITQSSSNKAQGTKHKALT